MTTPGDYEAPWWLPGAHLQTILAPWLVPALGRGVFTREQWRTPDGMDFIDVDWAGPEDAKRLLVLFHGLEGNSRSHYVRAIVARALKSGSWRCAIPHFRSCSGRPNDLPRAYHAGDSAEIDWILRRLRQAYPFEHVCAAGVSLGGNALLKWLGESGSDASNIVARAASVSAPIDLRASAGKLARGFGRVYGGYFLFVGGMRRKALDKVVRFPKQTSSLGINAATVRRAFTLPAFEDAVTAPLHGFRDAPDYWAKASALGHLDGICVPTLLLNARNDPFLPETALPSPGTLPAEVVLDFPAQGGHGGFPGHQDWLARRVIGFLGPP